MIFPYLNHTPLFNPVSRQNVQLTRQPIMFISRFASPNVWKGHTCRSYSKMVEQLFYCDAEAVLLDE